MARFEMKDMAEIDQTYKEKIREAEQKGPVYFHHNLIMKVYSQYCGEEGLDTDGDLYTAARDKVMKTIKGFKSKTCIKLIVCFFFLFFFFFWRGGFFIFSLSLYIFLYSLEFILRLLLIDLLIFIFRST
jgi:hypothetical protein